MEVWDSDILKRLSDVKIMVDDIVYDLHKIVLCVSPFFDTMLNGNFMESQQEIITLDFVKTEAWIYILKYLYYKIKNLTDLYGIEGDYYKNNFGPDIGFDIFEIQYSNLLEIREASDLLLLKELNEACEEILNDYHNITKETINESIDDYEKLSIIYDNMDDSLYNHLIKKLSGQSKYNLLDLVNDFIKNQYSNLSTDKKLWMDVLDLRFPKHQKTNDPLQELYNMLYNSIMSTR